MDGCSGGEGRVGTGGGPHSSKGNHVYSDAVPDKIDPCVVTHPD